MTEYDYVPHEYEVVEAHDRDRRYGVTHILKLRRDNSTYLHQASAEDLLNCADTIYETLCGAEMDIINREDVTAARARVEEYLNERRPMLGLDPNMIVGANHAQLLIGDIELLLRAAAKL